MLRISIGGIFHETNTFAAQKTTMDQFLSHTIVEGREIMDVYKNTKGSLGGVIDQAEERNIELAPALYAEATPSGMVDHQDYVKLSERLLERIPTDIDGVLLVLHGAMVTDYDQDPEGTLVKRVREKVGEQVPIVCTLDLHANITPAMNEYSDCMVGFDTYPHVDYYPRAVEATEILYQTIKGKIKPHSELSKPKFMPVVQRMLTDSSPMKDLLELAWMIEEDPKVVNVTVAGGFPYADVEWAGFSFLVTTNKDEKLAKKYLKQLEESLEKRKEDFLFSSKDPEIGIQEAKLLEDKPVILVDSSDNIGGGSSADGTVLLRLLLEHEMENSLVFIKDEEAVEYAEKVGVGEVFEFHVGGKTDNLHGDPVFVQGKVHLISDGTYVSERTGEKKRMGKTAVVISSGVYVVFTSARVPSFDLQAPKSLGIDPALLDYVVVKGAIQWKSSYGKIAANEVEVDCPGVTTAKLERFPYKNIRKGLFPLKEEANNVR